MAKNGSKTKIATRKPRVAKPKTRASKLHPIATAIDKFMHQARDIELAAKVHIPIAFDRRKGHFSNVRDTIDRSSSILDSREKAKHAKAITDVLNSLRNLERLQHSDVPKIIETSLFLGLFSAFDAFTGGLLRAIYSRKPELFKSINRQIEFASVLDYKSFSDLKSSVLEKEIEDFRRDSYVEQFKKLEKLFSMPLMEFERWSNFVECGQRRNLITHNDGIVSQQYLDICSKFGYVPSDVKLGERVTLGPQYFLDSCELLMEVALKLGQTLWRKLFFKEIVEADRHLNNKVIYDMCLQPEAWRLGIVLGEFARDQKNSGDDFKKLFLINYCIALKFGGQGELARTILEGTDWSGLASSTNWQNQYY